MQGFGACLVARLAPRARIVPQGDDDIAGQHLLLEDAFVENDNETQLVIRLNAMTDTGAIQKDAYPQAALYDILHRVSRHPYPSSPAPCGALSFT